MAVVESVQGVQDLAAGDRSLQEEEPYNLVLTSTDRAGNEEQVFRATLMQVVTEVFTTKGITMTATEQAAVAATVKELAKTYAWLNPQEEASVPADQADYGFLDRPWQLQVPHLVLKPGGKRVSEFRDAGVIAAELQKAVDALGRLLAGVNEPVKAIQFLNNLVQAESKVPSLGSSFKSALFWRESVELGVKVARLNPVTTEVSASDAAGTFLNTLWRQGSTQAAQSGLGQFFGGLKTTQERVRSLEFADRLIGAAQLTTGLGGQQKDARFLSQLVGLGGSYASLKPNLINPQDAPNLFLDTLWRGGSDEQTLSKASGELMQFLNGISTSTSSQIADRRLELLQFENKLLNKLGGVKDTELQGQLGSSKYVNEMLDWGNKYIASKYDTDLVVNGLNGMFQEAYNSRPGQGTLVASTNSVSLFLRNDSWLSWIKGFGYSSTIKYIRLGDLERISESPAGSSRRTQDYLKLILEECFDRNVLDKAKVAYMLGTATHETGRFQSMAETNIDPVNSGYDLSIALMNDVRGDGYKYRGRGFVQLTGKIRYQYYTEHLVRVTQLDLLNDPSLASIPEYAAYIMVDYLVTGEAGKGIDWVYKQFGKINYSVGGAENPAVQGKQM